MREIVHLQAGQCGNQIGQKFWEVKICQNIGTKEKNELSSIALWAEQLVPRVYLVIS